MCPSLDLPGDQKLRVLVVDDEPTLRLGFAYALSNRTTTVETAANGRHALDRIEVVPFDLLILDLRMPEMDGIAVIDALRAEGNSVPVILCSAAMVPGAALRAIRHGVVDFLLKPVRPADLRKAIEFVIQPRDQPYPMAMKAARGLNRAEAIRLLESEETPGPRSVYWLSVLKAIEDADSTPRSDVAALEEKVRFSLSMLAFNSTPGQ